MSLAQATPTTSPEQRFRSLVRAWKASQGYTSSAAKMAMHPAYLQIIGMGPTALPLILDELRRETDHWFIALNSIAGIDPVPPEARGRIDLMSNAWLEWGRREGLIADNGS